MLYDVAMLTILAYTTFRGAARGMAWQLAAIAALVLCFLFATPLSLVIAPRLALDAPLNRWVAMLVIYLAFSFACFIVARMLRGWFEAMKFEEYDRHLGAVFGFIKGATLCLVVTFFVVCLLPGFRDNVLRTTSGRLAGEFIHRFAAVMPAEVDGIVEPYLRRYKASLVADNDGPQDRAAAEDSAAGEGDSPRDGLRFQLPPLLDELLGDVTERSSRDDRDPTERNSPDDPADSPTDDEPALDLSPWLEAITALLADAPRERQGYQEGIAALLRGIPQAVATAVLDDWQSDLRGSDPDPNPQTDVTTPLDDRIREGLQAAGVRLETLPRPVRERLRGAEDE